MKLTQKSLNQCWIINTLSKVFIHKMTVVIIKGEETNIYKRKLSKRKLE
jgi:hypothetical protein